VSNSLENKAELTRPFRFGLVLLPKFSSLTLSGLVEPLRIANYCHGQPLYQWTYLSVDGADVAGCSAYSVPTESISNDYSAYDAIIICGGWNAERYDNVALQRWLRQLSRHNVVLGAAEMGAYVLARAGLLSGYSATIHWHCQNAFKERYPDTDLRDQLFVIDRKRMTCAGGVSCLDMMIQDIQLRHGKALAAEVADQVLYSSSRDAEHAQRELAPGEQVAVPQLIRKAIEFMEANVERTIKIPQLAESLGLSQRKLERLFGKHFDCSAVAFYRKVRLQHARALLTQTDMSVLDICVACGFSSSSYFSKSYAEQFGMRPRDHRLAWPDSDKNPLWPGINSSIDSASRTRQTRSRSSH